MTVHDALHEIEANALGNLLARLTELQRAVTLARTNVTANRNPGGRYITTKAAAVAEALDIWTAAKHATTQAETAAAHHQKRRPAS